MKLLQELFSAISDLLDEHETETGLGSESTKPERQRQIESLYTSFGANKDFFRSADEDEILYKVAQNAAQSEGGPDAEAADVTIQNLTNRLELLAYLLYADFKISDLSPALRLDVARRSLALYQNVAEHTDTFSLERMERMTELEQWIEKNKVE